MYRLTAKEEEVMEMIWKIGPCAPKDVRALYTKPIPNINTVAASFQSLERKGYLTHEQRGRGYLYIPIIKQEDYGKSKFRSFVDRYFDGSFKKIVNSFIQDEELNREELIQLLEELETSERNSQ